MRHTIPGFNDRIDHSLAETKYEKSIRNDNEAAILFKRRVDIDRIREEKALQDEIKEVWQ